MRAENSCAPASRSEPEREALQRAEGRTCGSQGCRPSCSCRRRRRRCQRRLKSDSRKSREHRTPRLSQTSACARLTVSGPSSQAYPTKVLTYTLTTSKVAYFKRKYAEEEDLHQDYHGYFPKHLILPEDRTCILKLSLEKLRFLEDPETYLRRSVLINNLLRKIHLETEKESYEYFKEAPCYKTAYSDARKRLKFMVQECCSQSLYYEELHSYHIVPYASENAIYGMGYTSSHLEQNSQLLIYKMN